MKGYPDYNVYTHKQAQKAKWQQKGIVFMVRQDLVLNMLGPTKNKRILDFGSGVGTLLNIISQDNTTICHGLDMTPFCIELAKKGARNNAKYFLGDEKKNNLPNDYDAIICTEVLEHIEHEDDVIQFFREKLKRNGAVIVTVPSEKSQLKVPNHYRIYTKNSLRKLFESNGFETQSMQYYGFPMLKALITIYTNLFFRNWETKPDLLSAGCFEDRGLNLYNKMLPIMKQVLKIDKLFGYLGLGTGLAGKFTKL